MSGAAIKAIETRYKGYRFRSRLEARWAVFFDALGFHWDYEPEGFELGGAEGRYLPDFKVYRGNDGDYFWFEVKGSRPTSAEIAKLRALSIQDGHWCFVASRTLGVPKVRKSIVEGAWIAGFVPPAAVTPSNGFSEAQRIEAACLYGFYEDADGLFHIDCLYADDLEIVEREVMRPCVRVVVDPGVRMSGSNFGHGRLYRSPALKAAYEAARSARFEHGEKGAAR